MVFYLQSDVLESYCPPADVPVLLYVIAFGSSKIPFPSSTGSSISACFAEGLLPLYSQNWKKKMESKKIEVIERMNLTRLKAPAAKNGYPKPIDKTADCRKESDPPMKSRTTFSIDQPSQLCLFQLR